MIPEQKKASRIQQKLIILAMLLASIEMSCTPTTIDVPVGSAKTTFELAAEEFPTSPNHRTPQTETPLDVHLHLPLIQHTTRETAIWHATPGLSWQWELSSEQPSIAVEAQVYDVDLYVDQTLLDQLKQRGIKLICYISVGSWEEWRPDADQFPPEVLGKDYAGWQGEKWLDIRQIDKLAPIMQGRLDLCAAKGFDAVEPDNMEVTGNDSGFPITVEDEQRYALWLAEQAHQRHLAIGMKNTVHLVSHLLPYFEFMITEDCFAQGWCEQASPFIAQGKAIFAAEYTDEWTPSQFQSQVCPQAQAGNFSAILKNRSLDAWRITCPPAQEAR
ncbi:MAG: hypothetical protein Kow0088_12560 [Anaerolineales bacterium]